MFKFRLAAFHLALAAMLLRAMMPAGWMPSTDAAASGSPFVICTMHGPLVPQKHDEHKSSNDVCPFAAAAQLAEAGKPAVLALPSTAPTHIEPITQPVFVGLPARHTPQSPRAPPLAA